MVDQGSLYRNIYHIRHSNIKKYNRELEIISHAIQGDEMNISNQFHTRRSLFKKCKHFRINFARKLTFLLTFFKLEMHM